MSLQNTFLPQEGHVDFTTGVTPNGLKMFSVTRVLSPWSTEAFSEAGIPENKLHNAAAKGTLVHTWCGCYAQSLFSPDLPDGYKGYAESFKRWFDVYGGEVIFAEERLYDYDLGFHGRPDLFLADGFLPGKNVLLDLKTPVTFSPYWSVQLAAYKHLLVRNGYFPQSVASLQLDIDGKWPKLKVHTYSDRDLAIFISALNVRRHFDA